MFSLSPISLLSHSAVVARELGLPTIVGVSGGLMKRLKTGMRVHVDAGKGRVTILREEHWCTQQKSKNNTVVSFPGSPVHERWKAGRGLGMRLITQSVCTSAWNRAFPFQILSLSFSRKQNRNYTTNDLCLQYFLGPSSTLYSWFF